MKYDSNHPITVNDSCDIYDVTEWVCCARRELLHVKNELIWIIQMNIWIFHFYLLYK